MQTKIIIDPLICEGLIKNPRINLADGTHLDGHTIGRLKYTGDELIVTVPSEPLKEPFENEKFKADEVPEINEEQAVVMGVRKDGTYDLILFDIDLLREVRDVSVDTDDEES